MLALRRSPAVVLFVARAQVDSARANRLEMLETIREYALERLAVSGAEEALCRAHAGYYLAMADSAEQYIPDTQHGDRPPSPRQLAFPLLSGCWC